MASTEGHRAEAICARLWRSARKLRAEVLTAAERHKIEGDAETLELGCDAGLRQARASAEPWSTAAEMLAEGRALRRPDRIAIGWLFEAVEGSDLVEWKRGEAHAALAWLIRCSRYTRRVAGELIAEALAADGKLEPGSVASAARSNPHRPPRPEEPAA